MKYKITKNYCWYNDKTEIVLMYFINGVAFTFDELPKDKENDALIIGMANQTESYDPEDLYRSSFYLIDEEAHPCLFELELENPEDMPSDVYEDK
jgi:hypothetical protein